MKITKVTASKNFDRYYYGKEEAEKYGDLICDKLAGKTVSKRKDLAEYPGGLIYEAEKLGIEDFFDLLKALEGLCYQGRAAEIDDSTYKVFEAEGIAAGTDYKRISRFNEYDNPHILRGDWAKMSDEEAEEEARKLSIDDPTDVYYVQYDDVMDPASDKRWLRGKSYDASSQYEELMKVKRQPVESAQAITAASNLPKELRYIYDDLKYTLGSQHVGLAVTANLGNGQTAFITLNTPVDNQVLLTAVDFSDEVFEAPEEAVNYVLDEWNKEHIVDSSEEIEELEDVESSKEIKASTSTDAQSTDKPFEFGCVTC